MPYRLIFNVFLLAFSSVLLSNATALAFQGETDETAAEVTSDAEMSTESESDESHDGESHDDHAASEHAEGSHSGGHGEHHHLTEGAPSDGLHEPMSIRADKTLFTLVVFGLLCAALYCVAWKPVMKGLADREEKIAGNIEKAEAALKDAESKLAEYQSKLDSATTEASELVAQAKKDAEAAGERIVAEAQQEATRQRDRALAEIEAAKVAALSDISGKSTDMAFSMARNIVGRELKQDDHTGLIDQAVSALNKSN